jgi:outer membrane immunogenic protein
MKRLVLAGLGALAVMTMIGSANAADMSRRQAMPAKAPIYEAPYNWTGVYVGINGGGSWGRSTWSNPGGSADADLAGAIVGGTLGYNYQMGQAVFGLEGDVDWSNIHGSTSSGLCAGVTCETHNSWLATARGRIGYAFNRVMPFVTGGAAFGDIKAMPVGFGTSETTTKVGWTIGGGAEVAIAGPWSAKLEYLYVDLGKGSCGVVSCGVATDVSLTSNLVRGGLNYRF